MTIQQCNHGWATLCARTTCIVCDFEKAQAQIQRLREIIKDASAWVTSINPRPGPYHPDIAALIREASVETRPNEPS